MHVLRYIFLSTGTFLFGIIFYSIYNEIVIIRLPERNRDYTNNNCSVQKKKYVFYYWKNDKWHTEYKDLLASENKIQNLNYLISNWLNIINDEKENIKVALQSICFDLNSLHDNGSELFISFDRNPISKECSIYDKWMWVESLLKTISSNASKAESKEKNLKIKYVRLLVSHKPLNDQHLDFSRPWPITGFLD